MRQNFTQTSRQIKINEDVKNRAVCFHSHLIVLPARVIPHLHSALILHVVLFGSPQQSFE